MHNNFKSGFVTLLGKPNVGKSTLLNFLLKRKVAIVSDKPQTTRHKILGIYTAKDLQIVFLDTPGIHKPHSKLGTLLIKTAKKALIEVDLILFLVSALDAFKENYAFNLLKNIKTTCLLVINKIDKVASEELAQLIEKYRQFSFFKKIIPISALYGQNIPVLLEEIKKELKPGPKYYEEDIITDLKDDFLISELIREKVLELTYDEVPHAVNVLIDEMRFRETKEMVDIYATIIVEKESQKGILIGKKGELLKQVGIKARKDIESFLGCKVYLNLWVKVKKNWRNEEKILKDFGFF